MNCVLEKFDGNLWSYHLVVLKEIAENFISAENDRRVVCTINKKTSFQCALMHKGDGNYFININKKIRDAEKLKLGESVYIDLAKDTSKYGLPITDEMKECLEQDEEGSAIFHALTSGKQRTLIYIASQVKDTQKRISRALAILSHLKSTKGKINYKQLNETIKAMN